MNRQLDAGKLRDTIVGLQQRIGQRFEQSGLSGLAGEVVQITEASLPRAAAIARPNFWLRAGLGLLLAVAIAAIIVYVREREPQRPTWTELFQFLDAAKGSAAFLIAGAIFLVSLETRLKRRRALQAVHELRSMAHIIDMYQLTKDPDRLGDSPHSLDVAGKPMDVDDMVRYLHYCTEMLAVISKIGQLYVQDFPDPAAQTAVDHFEDLATRLSSKIWQKLMILDRIRSGSRSGTLTSE